MANPSKTGSATPRRAIAARPAGSDPAAAIGEGVKTTPKEAKAFAGKPKRSPGFAVVAPAPRLARWAMNSRENVATVSDATVAPRYAYNIILTRPSEVYTAGFQTDKQVADANRFAGNAVKFLPIARFQTN